MGCFNSKGQKDKDNSYKNTSSQSQKYFLPIKKQYDPNSQHLKLWENYLQINILKIEIVFNFNGLPEHPCFKQIQKDISRTFPNEDYFCQIQHQQEFRIVLKNYAINFPKIGYTQGLNFVAGYLLLSKMKVQPASKCFIQISRHSELMCVGLYEDNFPLCYLYCALFWKVLEQLQPKLAHKIRAFNISDEVWIFQWFLTFFIYSFPIQYIDSFFQFIFKFKKFAMVRLAISIIGCLKKEIKKIKDDNDSYFQFTSCLDLLKHHDECQRRLNIHELIAYAQNTVTEELLQKGLTKIKEQKTINNFYLKYFSAQQNEQKQMYSKFIFQLEQNKQILTKSKNSQSLQNSYRRARQSVQIIDQIMYQSLKRTQDRKCKSNLDSLLNKNNKHLIFRHDTDQLNNYQQMWKSQANLGSFQQKKISFDKKQKNFLLYENSNSGNNFYNSNLNSIVMKYTTQEDIQAKQGQIEQISQQKNLDLNQMNIINNQNFQQLK